MYRLFFAMVALLLALPTNSKTQEIMGALEEYVDCTPICGNPTCCIARSIQVPVVFSPLEIAEAYDAMGSSPAGLPMRLIARDEDPMAINEDVLQQIDGEIVGDLNELRAIGDQWMRQTEVVQGCTYECWSCSSGTCCGWVWR